MKHIITIPKQIIEIPERQIEIELPDPIAVPPPAPKPTRFFSPDSFWNKKLEPEPPSINSAALVKELFENVKLASGWINTTSYSRPVYIVNNLSTNIRPVKLLRDTYGSVALELLRGIPIPTNFKGAMGGDGHATIIDRMTDTEYDFWQLKMVNGEWVATNAGILHYMSDSDGIMPRLNVWNSATASHLPLAGGLIMKSELEAGLIPHALAIAINRPKKFPAVVWPASTTDGWYDSPNAIPEGTRFRFPENTVIESSWAPITKMLVEAVRNYGMVVMDKTGSGVSFYVQDPTQFGLNETMLDPYMGGKKMWNILGDKSNLTPEFPWKLLVALK